MKVTIAYIRPDGEVAEAVFKDNDRSTDNQAIRTGPIVLKGIPKVLK